MAAMAPPTADRIVLLGTGTCQLEAERTASSALVEVDGLRLVFDFGRGVARRLVEHGLAQDDVEHVVLSHFHPDHLSDLVPYLHAACWSQVDPRSRDLHVHGPAGLRVQLMRLLSLFEPGTLERETFRVHLHEVHGEELEIAGRRFGWPELPPAGNHGLVIERGGRRHVLTGDSHFHAREVEAVRGTALAVIDAGHLRDDEIVELAAAAGPDLLVCSHLYRELDGAQLGRRAAKAGFAGRLVVGRDGMELPLTSM